MPSFGSISSLPISTFSVGSTQELDCSIEIISNQSLIIGHLHDSTIRWPDSRFYCDSMITLTYASVIASMGVSTEESVLGNNIIVAHGELEFVIDSGSININLTKSATADAQSIFENSHITQSILSVFTSTDLLLELVADNESFVNIEISFDGIFENNHSLNLTRVIMAELHLESETVYTTNLIFSAQSEFSSFIDVVSLASLILDAATSFPVFTEYDPNIDLIVGLFGSLDIINKAGVLIDEALALEIVVSNDINIENSAILNRIISINSSFDTVTQLIISADFTAEFIALIFNYTMYIQREKDTILRTL